MFREDVPWSMLQVYSHVRILTVDIENALS